MACLADPGGFHTLQTTRGVFQKEQIRGCSAGRVARPGRKGTRPSRLQGRLKGAFTDSRLSTGLGETEMTVLNAVAEAPSPPTVPQIGRALGHPRQVIQRAANALITAGLIATRDNPDHKRAVLLIPTWLLFVVWVFAAGFAVTGPTVRTPLKKVTVCCCKPLPNVSSSGCVWSMWAMPDQWP